MTGQQLRTVNVPFAVKNFSVKFDYIANIWLYTNKFKLQVSMWKYGVLLYTIFSIRIGIVYTSFFILNNELLSNRFILYQILCLLIYCSCGKGFFRSNSFDNAWGRINRKCSRTAFTFSKKLRKWRCYRADCGFVRDLKRGATANSKMYCFTHW